MMEGFFGLCKAGSQKKQILICFVSHQPSLLHSSLMFPLPLQSENQQNKQGWFDRMQKLSLLGPTNKEAELPILALHTVPLTEQV